MRYHILPGLLGALALTACTWVTTTEQGAQVRLVTEVQPSCQHLGTVTTSVKDQVGPFVRNEARVREELVSLARNRAAVLGGNVIFLDQEPVAGEATFDVFTCP